MQVSAVARACGARSVGRSRRSTRRPDPRSPREPRALDRPEVPWSTADPGRPTAALLERSREPRVRTVPGLRAGWSPPRPLRQARWAGAGSWRCCWERRSWPCRWRTNEATSYPRWTTSTSTSSTAAVRSMSRRATSRATS
ncbi:hypothetical protein HBB16_11560 [Pseudonocardia sp. MCCB 268]|nr:hypothetical protein [Pseudonocardia cytotoxica]